MKKTTFLFLIAFFLLCASTAQAQLDISYQNTEPKMPTWQTYEFMRYGKVASSLYTGTVNYSIPFYTYKDNDFEIPISFDYASNGFRTNSQTGSLGHDWLLNVGGTITREIKGIPDDLSISVIAPNGTGINPRGFYYAYLNGLNQPSVIPQIFLNSSGNLVFYNEVKSGGNYYHYDLEPDIFHFNFMGYSGSFHFWYNGEMKIFNSTGASSGIKIKFYDGTKSFEITTPDGYKFIFDNNNGEYVSIRNNSGLEEKTIVSWKISAIIAPNDRRVDFYYGIQTAPGSKNNYKYIPRTNYYQMVCPLSDVDNTISDYLELKTENVISDPLDSIRITGNTTIKFSSTISNTEKYIYNSKIKDAYIKTALINKIEVLHNNLIVKKCDLDYKFSKAYSSTVTGNIIPFLGSVKISGEGTYSLDYYDLANKTFPYLGSFSFDHWGYYNGKNDYLNPVDMTKSLSYDSQYNESLNTTLKNPDSTYAIRGMLKRIAYPTGGYSELGYEPHKYSAKIVRNSQNSFVPSLSYLTNDEITGGLRIKKIVNYNSVGIKSDSLSYFYVGSNNCSSGVQINVPRYGVEYTANSGSYQKYIKFYSSSNDIYAYDKTHIEYSHVTEKKSDNSTIDYYFTTSLTYPDEFIGDVTSNPVPTYLQYGSSYTYLYFSVNGAGLGLTNILTPTTSFQSKRGHLWRKETHDANGVLLRNEITNYEFPSISQLVTPKIVGEVWKNISSKEINHQIASTSITNYENNAQVNNETGFAYNMKGQTTNSRTTTSLGDTLVTKYVYVGDITPVPTNGIYKNMLDNNVINYPIQETVYLKKGGILKQISAKRYTYINPNASKLCLIRPSKVEIWNQNETWSTAIKYNNYDDIGNLLEMEDKNGRCTVFLWSYGGKCLIAKIDNATYAQVNTALSSSGLTSAAALSAMTDPGDNIINYCCPVKISGPKN